MKRGSSLRTRLLSLHIEYPYSLGLFAGPGGLYWRDSFDGESGVLLECKEARLERVAASALGILTRRRRAVRRKNAETWRRAIEIELGLRTGNGVWRQAA